MEANLQRDHILLEELSAKTRAVYEEMKRRIGVTRHWTLRLPVVRPKHATIGDTSEHV
jgi:hypothetical protein